MGTAQAFYEIYKTLPNKTKKEVQDLIKEEEETIAISVKHLKEALKEIKKLKKGTAKILTEEEFLKELKAQ